MLFNKAHLLFQLLVLIENKGVDLSDFLQTVEVLAGHAQLIQPLQLFLRGGSLSLNRFFSRGAIRGLRAPFFLQFEEVVPDLNIFLLR